MNQVRPDKTEMVRNYIGKALNVNAWGEQQHFRLPGVTRGLKRILSGVLYFVCTYAIIVGIEGKRKQRHIAVLRCS